MYVYVHAIVTGNSAINYVYSYPLDGSQHIREVYKLQIYKCTRGVGIGGNVACSRVKHKAEYDFNVQNLKEFIAIEILITHSNWIIPIPYL